MKFNGILIAAFAASTALTACSGGGSGGGSSVVSRSGNTGADQVLAVDAGNAAQALEDGTTLKASQRASSGWSRNFEAETGALTADTTASIQRNADGGVDLIVGGRTISFTAADLTSDGGFRLPDGSAGIYNWNYNTMEEALDPANGNYSLAFDYWYDNDDGTGANGHAVIGTETENSEIANLPTATYSGWAQIRVAPTEGFNDYNDDVNQARGDLALTANFGAGKVSGDVTNLESRLPNNVDPTQSWTPFDGALTLQETDIEGNGFTGAITSDADFDTNFGSIDNGSTYSGTFFGPNGEEVGGGINGTGTSAVNGTPWIGFGVFQGYKN